MTRARPWLLTVCVIGVFVDITTGPVSWEAFMAEARRSHPYDGEVAGATPRMHSVMVHPTRLSFVPDADRFHPVHNRRHWRCRPAACQRKPVSKDLVGLCFNCLGTTMSRLIVSSVMLSYLQACGTPCSPLPLRPRLRWGQAVALAGALR